MISLRSGQTDPSAVSSFCVNDASLDGVGMGRCSTKFCKEQFSLVASSRHYSPTLRMAGAHLYGQLLGSGRRMRRLVLRRDPNDRDLLLRLLSSFTLLYVPFGIYIMSSVHGHVSHVPVVQVSVFVQVDICPGFFCRCLIVFDVFGA